jgi:hypothetical protein
MIPGTHALVTERTGFMARLPPAGVILQATAPGGKQIRCFPKPTTIPWRVAGYAEVIPGNPIKSLLPECRPSVRDFLPMED